VGGGGRAGDVHAGVAFLEAGMTRMKNAAHVAGKNVLTFALCR
jgi:Amt family ammonium transporter